MAILYDVDLSPTKLDLLKAWVPRQSWTDITELTCVSSFRFDDPAGEVGIEVHLVSDPAQPRVIYQIPLTYRGAPRPGAEDHLVTEMDHPKLGRRWVYDGVADPVCIAEFVRAINTGAGSVEEYWQTDEGLVKNEGHATAWGTGPLEQGVGELPSGPELDALPVQVDNVGELTLSILNGVKVATLRVLSPVRVDALAAPAGQLQVKIGAEEYVSARIMG